MQTPGIFSGRVFKGTNPDREGVQYGPLPIPKIPDPVDQLLQGSIGEFPYQANGLVEFRPEKIEYLKS